MVPRQSLEELLCPSDIPSILTKTVQKPPKRHRGQLLPIIGKKLPDNSHALARQLHIGAALGLVVLIARLRCARRRRSAIVNNSDAQAWRTLEPSDSERHSKVYGPSLRDILKFTVLLGPTMGAAGQPIGAGAARFPGNTGAPPKPQL